MCNSELEPNISIGKIQRVPLRDVWKHEARDFSSWLADNIDILNEATGLTLTPPERERPAGDFSVDLVSEDGDGGIVIIENQLEKSDHDHLGKVLTYVAAYQATVAVWIVGEPRTEHAAAIAWLNQTSATDFYLLKAEAIRIGDSAPALMLTLVIGPTPETKVIGDNKRDIAERHTLRKQFWTSLLNLANTRTKWHRNVTPGDDTWLSATTGQPGFWYVYMIGKDYWRVRLEIYSDSKSWNKAAFEHLRSQQELIESRFGHPLLWHEKPRELFSSLELEVAGKGYRVPAEEWPGIQEAMIEAMIRLVDAVGAFLKDAASYAASKDRLSPES